MAHQLIAGEAERRLAFDASSLMEARAARTRLSDLLLLAASPVNLLVVGRERMTRAVLDQLRRRLRQPVLEWRAGDTLPLPVYPATGTLMLYEVGALRADEQTRMLEWMGHSPGRWRVVSTNTAPLFPLVTLGRFDDALFYRLNVLYVDLR
jgi:hypothetical protein